jgi:hypothetical protein
MGYRDQEYKLSRGGRGSYSYYLGYDEIPHNLSLSTTLHR